MNRGQAALEFLSTYGFAFFILLLTLGVINYLGIFNMSSLRSNECSFPQGADCVDFVLNKADNGSGSTLPYARMIIYNSYGVNLTITRADLTLTEVTNPIVCSLEPTGMWQRGQNKTLWCAIPAAAYVPTHRYDGVIDLSFTQTGGTFNHAVKGSLSLVAQ